MNDISRAIYACVHCSREIRVHPTKKEWVHTRDLKKTCMRKPGRDFTSATPTITNLAENAA